MTTEEIYEGYAEDSLLRRFLVLQALYVLRKAFNGGEESQVADGDILVGRGGHSSLDSGNRLDESV